MGYDIFRFYKWIDKEGKIHYKTKMIIKSGGYYDDDDALSIDPSVSLETFEKLFFERKKRYFDMENKCLISTWKNM